MTARGGTMTPLDLARRLVADELAEGDTRGIEDEDYWLTRADEFLIPLAGAGLLTDPAALASERARSQRLQEENERLRDALADAIEWAVARTAELHVHQSGWWSAKHGTGWSDVATCEHPYCARVRDMEAGAALKDSSDA